MNPEPKHSKGWTREEIVNDEVMGRYLSRPGKHAAPRPYIACSICRDKYPHS